MKLGSELNGIEHFDLGQKYESESKCEDAIFHYLNASQLIKHPIAMKKLGINFITLPLEIDEEYFSELLNFDADTLDEKSDPVNRGFMLLSGIGIEQNFIEGIKLLLKSAKSDRNPIAQWLVATIIFNISKFATKCTTKDFLSKEVFKFCQLAAEQKDANGQCSLGACLDLLAMVTNQQYEKPEDAWENGVKSYRESIKKFLFVILILVIKI